MQKMVQNVIRLEQDALKEREKCKLLENKYKEKEFLIAEI